MSDYYLTKEDYLAHHGIKGMKWGLRNFQNLDGTYTELGKLRRRKSDSYSEDQKRYQNLRKKNYKQLSTKEIEEINRRDNAVSQYVRNHQGSGKRFISSLSNNILNGAAAAIGGYAVSVGMKYIKNRLRLS